MIDTATFHVYVDGPGAVVDFLADAELAIRDPGHTIEYGTAYHLISTLYNWLQFRALLPGGRADLLDLVAQLRQAIDQVDPVLLKATVT